MKQNTFLRMNACDQIDGLERGYIYAVCVDVIESSPIMRIRKMMQLCCNKPGCEKSSAVRIIIRLHLLNLW